MYNKCTENLKVSPGAWPSIHVFIFSRKFEIFYCMLYFALLDSFKIHRCSGKQTQYATQSNNGHLYRNFGVSKTVLFVHLIVLELWSRRGRLFYLVSKYRMTRRIQCTRVLGSCCGLYLAVTANYSCTRTYIMCTT